MLVSNLGQPNSGTNLGLQNFDLAQSFSTGSDGGGYTLKSVDLQFRALNDPNAYWRIRVTIQSDSAGSPGTLVGTLTNPFFQSTSTDRTYNFTAPSGGIQLAADTTYWVVVDVTGSLTQGSNSFRVTYSAGGLDDGGVSGWSIGGTYLIRGRAVNPWRSPPRSGSYKIRINGDVNPTEPPKPPGPPPQVSITGGDAVSEGANASFTLRATPAPTSSIQVNVNVADSGGGGGPLPQSKTVGG